MKILQINSVHYRRGGADVVYLNTGKLLEEHGHEVYYFSQKNENNYPASTSEFFIKPTNYFRKTTIQKIVSVPRFFYSFEAAKKLEKLIKKQQPDIAHIHLYKADLTPSILKVLSNNNVPIVITLHDFGFICPHNLLLDGKMNICERCVNGSSLNCIIHKCNRNNIVLSALSSFEYIFQQAFFPFDKYFDTIIAVSRFSQEKHLESRKFNWEIKHLYNFFPDLKLTKPNHFKGDYMLFFGRLSKEKGIETLINTWQSNNIKTKLKVVGTGELLEKYKNIKYKNVEFLGFKNGDELTSLIKNASFVIIPSEVQENNPLTIIESYSFGKPVIASNVGGIPEIVLNYKTGFLFEMGNADDLSEKIKLAKKTSPKEYLKMSQNARNFAEEHFDEDKHYNALIAIYKETLVRYKIHK